MGIFNFLFVIIMKNTYNPSKNFALVADGIEFDEMRKVNKSQAKMRKINQSRDALKAQEAEFYANTRENLFDTFDQTSHLDSRIKSHKIQLKSDLHQVFSMQHQAMTA